MKIRLDLRLYSDDGVRFWGEGPCQLLQGVQELGSLRASAKRMRMAYSKAFHIIKNAETVLGIQLIQRTIGGRNGGGSVLTPEAKELLKRYEGYRDNCTKMAERLYLEYFSGFWQETSAVDGPERQRQNDSDRGLSRT